MHLRYLLIAAVPALAFLAASSCKQQPLAEHDAYPSWPSKVPEGKIDFAKNVRPILVINCLECHNNENAKDNGNLSLETRELALTTGDHAPVILPGKAEDSLLIQALKLDGIHYGAMPPTPDKIWGVRMEILRRWIDEGAKWPESVTLVHPGKLTEW